MQQIEELFLNITRSIRLIDCEIMQKRNFTLKKEILKTVSMSHVETEMKIEWEKFELF